MAPAVAGVALFLVAVGRFVPWGWPEPAAALVVLGVAAAIGAWAIAQRLPVFVVARSADRGLATGDTFGAALQFQDLGGPFGERIRDRAERLAAGAEVEEAAPIEPNGRRWAVAGAIGTAALVLALAPNPQDDIRAEQARTAALIEATADALDERADALAEDPGAEEVAARAGGAGR